MTRVPTLKIQHQMGEVSPIIFFIFIYHLRFTGMVTNIILPSGIDIIRVFIVYFPLTDYDQIAAQPDRSRMKRPSVTITSPGSPGTTRPRPHSPQMCGKVQVSSGCVDRWRSPLCQFTLLLRPWLVTSFGISAIADDPISPCCPVCCVLFQPLSSLSYTHLSILGLASLFFFSLVCPHLAFFSLCAPLSSSSHNCSGFWCIHLPSPLAPVITTINYGISVTPN